MADESFAAERDLLRIGMVEDHELLVDGLRDPNRFGQVATSPVVVQDVSPWQRRGSWTTSYGQ